MAIVIVEKLSKEDLQKAREDYPEYLKITADIVQRIVAIGGEYHADAEKILREDYQSKKKDIWGGGYNLILKKIETNAIVNLKPEVNDSPEILDPVTREDFLEVVQEKLSDIELLI